MSDRFDLSRFRLAQDQHDTYEQALRELREGHKRSHWMWFIFPQLAGLGRTASAQRFAIPGIEEAVAYLGDPVLGVRLVESAQALLRLPGRRADDVLGAIDAVKLRSSMTLFARAAPHEPVFRRVLERFFDGETDPVSERLLGPA